MFWKTAKEQEYLDSRSDSGSGRAVPNTSRIGLENVGIETEKGFIKVGSFYQTSVPNIYAAGDVINTPLLAHVASKKPKLQLNT